MSHHIKVVIYDLHPRVINIVAKEWGLTLDDERLSVSSYARANKILFNGGFEHYNIAVELAAKLNAKLDIYLPALLTDAESEPPSWIEKLGDMANIILVPITAETGLSIVSSSAVHSPAKHVSNKIDEKEPISGGEKQNKKSRASSKKKTVSKEYTEDQAESILDYFDVNITGAREGDIILGVAKQNSKTLVRVHGDPVQPKSKELDALRQHPLIWKKFIRKLAVIPFFASLTRTEREQWLENNENARDDYIGEESDDFWVELLQPGQGCLISEEVEPSDLEAIMEGNPNHPKQWWSAQDIIEIIPAKPGSKGLKGRHVLFWNKNWWKIIPEPKSVDSFVGLTFDLTSGEALSSSASNGQKLIVIDDVTLERSSPTKASKTSKRAGETSATMTWHAARSGEIAFLVENEMMVLSWPEVTRIILELCEWFTGPQTELLKLLELVKANFAQYTAATYKSLMQKIIRFRAKQIALFVNMEMAESETVIDTRIVLLATMAALLINPGSFVPDIQRYVSGLESFAKRLGVSIVEDSSIDDPRKIQSLWSGALLAQRVRSWRPSRSLVKKWFGYGMEAWQRSEKYIFDNDIGLKHDPFVLSPTNSPFQNCSALIDELRSFEGDIAMTRYIAAHYEEATRLWGQEKIEEIAIMPIYHHLDQHSCTPIAWYVDPVLAREIMELSDEPASRPFSSLFYRLFSEDTGFNPRPPGHLGRTRRQKTLHWRPSDDFISAMSVAQRIVIRSKQRKAIARLSDPAGGHKASPLTPVQNNLVQADSYALEYKLDVAWLPALIGSIEIKGSPPVIAMLDAKDPLNVIVVRRPARQMKDEELSAEREEQAKEEARKILRSGVKLKAVSSPCAFLDHATAYLRTDENGLEGYVVISKTSEEKTWEEARMIRLQLPYHPRLEPHNKKFTYDEITLSQALLNIGDGLQVNAWDDLNVLCKETDDRAIRRALFYISSFKASFEINPIGRSGGGTKGSVTIDDIAANQFLLRLSILFPGALRPVQFQPGKFTSPVPPLLWTVRDTIKEKIRGKESVNWKCLELWDRKEWKLWEHQESSIKEMVDNHKRGVRGTFLYQPVGLGKTIQVLYYLKYLADNNELSPYIVYSLPSSAIKSVANEILSMGFSITLILPIKGKKEIDVPDTVKISRECQLEPGIINLIEHDHLRKCQEELSLVADRTIVIFDEVHKMLRESQRTNAALQLSRLSKEFIVLTGTPVIDNRIYRLIPWLEQIVPVEINEANFWVAAATMVSRKATTGIKTEHEYVEASFSPSEELKYQKLVPPGLGGVSSTSKIDQIREATDLSYSACDREMITQTMKLIEEKTGVMMVASSEAHQNKLRDMLVKAGIKSRKIFLLTNKQSLFLTDEAVESGEVTGYKVVITTVRHNAGYTLTFLGALVSGIYPSNQSSRDQLEGRINRIGSRHDLLRYIYVHCGTLTYIMNNHDQARSLAIAISDMATEIEPLHAS